MSSIKRLAIDALNFAVPATIKAGAAFCKHYRKELPYAFLVFLFWSLLSMHLQNAQAATTTPQPQPPIISLEASESPTIVPTTKQVSDTQPPTKEALEAIIRAQAQEAYIDPDVAVAIARCESQLNPTATNWQGSTAKGIYQFTDPTWRYIKANGHQFDYMENIRQFMIWYPKYPHWWACHDIVMTQRDIVMK